METALRLRIESGSLAGQEFDLGNTPLLLGRAVECQIRFNSFNEPEVSKHHAEVYRDTSGVYLVDQNSSNGTLVNGARIRRVSLRVGDTIRLGPNGPVVRLLAATEPGVSTTLPSPSISLSSLKKPTYYDPYKDKGRHYNFAAITACFGVMAISIFFTLVMLLLALFPMKLGEALVGVLVAFLPAPFYLMIWLWLDRYDPEPAWALASSLLWGAGIATFISYIINSVVGAVFASATGSDAIGRFASASLSAPIVEEASKGLAVVLVFLLLRQEFDDIIDGILYAGVVALGFATVENVFYYGQNFAKEGLSGLLATFVVRGVLDPFGHSVFTSMTGIGCGIARTTHKKAWRVFAPLLGYFAAVVLHFLWNTIASLSGGLGMIIYYFLIWLPFLGVFIGVIIYLGYRESALIQRMLAPELAVGLVTAKELAITGSWLRQLGWLLSSISDWPRLQARRRFLRNATRLALSYWHVEQARAAGGHTISLSRIPIFRRVLEALKNQV